MTDDLHISFKTTGRCRVRMAQIGGAPDFLRGFRIVFATDLHVNRHFSDTAVGVFFENVLAQRPDMLLMGGDYAEDAAGQVRFFAALKAFFPRFARPPLLAVGNNDKESLPVRALKKLARDAGAKMLINEKEEVVFAEKKLVVAAVDEKKYGHPAISGLFPPDADFRILLSHYPAPPKDAVGEYADLQLSGHTHGGQLRLFGLSPFSFGLEGGYPLILGDGKIGQVRTIVSGGVGTSRLPVRLGVAPQIHLVEFDKERKNVP